MTYIRIYAEKYVWEKFKKLVMLCEVNNNNNNVRLMKVTFLEILYNYEFYNSNISRSDICNFYAIKRYLLHSAEEITTAELRRLAFEVLEWNPRQGRVSKSCRAAVWTI